MADNWYNLIETQIVHTLNAHTWLGTAGTTVVTREAKLRSGPRSYLDHELPAIAVKCFHKRQEHITHEEFDKFYSFVAFILHRGGALDSVVDTVQKIASNLEDELGLHYGGTNDLSGLGTHADIHGGPIVTVGATEFIYTQETEASFTVLATVDGVVNIVTT